MRKIVRMPLPSLALYAEEMQALQIKVSLAPPALCLSQITQLVGHFLVRICAEIVNRLGTQINFKSSIYSCIIVADYLFKDLSTYSFDD